MSQFNTQPTYEQPLMQGKATSSVYYRFFVGLFQGTPPSAENTVTVGTSPFTFIAPQRGFVIVQGGTVSLVQFSRGGATNYTTGQTQGCFPLSKGDQVIVTYSALPAMTFVPQ